jgi:hypothetical protein
MGHLARLPAHGEITSGRIVQDITRTGLSRADFIVLMELNQSKDLPPPRANCWTTWNGTRRASRTS